MICVLLMVGYGHGFYEGFYKSCKYECQDGTRRYYRVSPDYICPKALRESRP